MKRRGLLAALETPVDGASLGAFRAVFGVLMLGQCAALARRLASGSLAELLDPARFHFTYWGFGWVKPLPIAGIWLVCALASAASVGVALGLYARASALALFLCSSYLFLLDQSVYVNHLYFICLVSLLLALVPSGAAYSLDARRGAPAGARAVPAGALWLLRAQVALVYLHSGLAKLNPDWLQGYPLKFWIAQGILRLPGPAASHAAASALILSYAGLALDLGLVPLLLWPRTRKPAFVLAALFHLSNAGLFSIGLFPWLMIAANSLFLAPDWPRRRPPAKLPPSQAPRSPALWAAAGLYLALQALLPLRRLLYPGNASWTEQGHRFSWHMMLRTKTGRTRFFAADPTSGAALAIDPASELTPGQAQAMAGDPDMILQYAHHLAERLRAQGWQDVQVRAEALVSLNGRRPQLLVDPAADLASWPRDLRPKPWILPLREPLPRLRLQ